jgi:hypothetical protein
MAIRYFTMTLEGAAYKGYKDEEGKDLEPSDRTGVFRQEYYLEEDLENVPPSQVTLVGLDRDPEAPEDATLGRDYSWVLQELEKCAKQLNDYEMDEMVRLE